MEALYPVTVTRVIRRLTRFSKAHLVEANDGQYYVVKPLYDTEQIKVAVEEWLITEILRTFGIATPSVASIKLPASGICLEHEQLAAAPRKWPHFASHVPVNPLESSIFDLLPRKLLSRVENVDDFWKIAVIDTLTQKPARRQAIFYRHSDSRVLQAGFIDHKCHLFALLSGDLVDFAREFAARLKFEYHQVNLNVPALINFCAMLEDSCWTTFLGRSQPIPAAWKEHVGEEAVQRSLKFLWQRFRRLRAHMSAALWTNGINPSLRMT